MIIEASALTTTADHDVIFAGVIGKKAVTTIDYQVRDNNAGPVAIGSFGLGGVDTDRDLSSAGQTNHLSRADVTLLDFTVVDLDNDGNADIGVISQSPAGFFVGVTGDGTGNGTQDQGGPTTATAVDNAGIFFGTPNDGYNIGTNLLNIKSGDLDGDGNVNDVAVLHITADGKHANLAEIKFAAGAQNFANPKATLLSDTTIGRPGGNQHFFGLYYPPAIPNPDPTSPAVFISSEQAPSFVLSDLQGANFYSESAGGLLPGFLFHVGTTINAGDGGNSTVGTGGTGGKLGSSFTTATVTDPVSGAKTQTLIGSTQLYFLRRHFPERRRRRQRFCQWRQRRQYHRRFFHLSG